MSHPITRCECHGTEPCQFCIDRHITSIPEDSTQPVGHAAVDTLRKKIKELEQIISSQEDTISVLEAGFRP